MYPSVLPYRKRQEEYWETNDIVKIIDDFDSVIRPIRYELRFLRLNESGDFKTQDDVDKADVLASVLYQRYKLITYAYSARRDLSFKFLNSLRVMGSGHDGGNNGVCDVFKPHSHITDYFQFMAFYNEGYLNKHTQITRDLAKQYKHVRKSLPWVCPAGTIIYRTFFSTKVECGKHCTVCMRKNPRKVVLFCAH